ncbi:DUF6236 family protein [Halomonas sp. G15]|uniref:DUF6236 family protein n=1 Tax=Halomonas sp. G15 TaxID=2903521 RepID=UPI001E4D68AB|nr:DUF6236 family protein [Halomonas sp. G15]MCE0733505.1 DUF6236 family protein [Halomonas sp. G15]
MELIEGGIKINNARIESQKLFHYLLYWDRIAFPTNNVIHIPPQPDIQFLAQEGEAEIINVTTEGEFNADDKFFVALQNITHHQLSVRGDIEWCIGKPLRESLQDPEAPDFKSTIEMDLYNAIPVPNSCHHIEDILSFKKKRNPELQELRHVIDAMKLEAQINYTNPLARKKQIKKIQSAIDQIQTCLHESKLSFIRRSAKIIANSPVNFYGGLAATIAGFSYPPLLIPILIGSSSIACISSAPRIMNIGDRLPDSLKSYAYIACANRELGN